MKDSHTHSGTYKIRIGDINYGGHMGNDKALLLFHDARIDFLEQHGFSEGDFGGAGMIMSDAHVYFKKEVFRGDELKVYVHIENLRGISFEMHYTVLCQEEEILHGSTKLIAFDYKLRKVVKIPEAFISSVTS